MLRDQAGRNLQQANLKGAENAKSVDAFQTAIKSDLEILQVRNSILLEEKV